MKFLFSNYRRKEKETELKLPDAPNELIEIEVARSFVKNGDSPYDFEKTLHEIRRFKAAHSTVYSLDNTIGDENGSRTYADGLADDDQTPVIDALIEQEDALTGRQFLAAAQGHFMSIGKEREWNILVARRLTEEPPTLEELGEIHDVSKERIRQLENKAFDRLLQYASRYKLQQIAQQTSTPSQRTKVFVPA